MSDNFEMNYNENLCPSCNESLDGYWTNIIITNDGDIITDCIPIKGLGNMIRLC